jgi:ubiquinone/menaquinone biosynthesis C-methylase UbiE
MNAVSRTDFVLAERERIQLESDRRARELSPELYAAWQPASQFMLESRNRTAAKMLHDSQVFRQSSDKCLEVGFGAIGWLSTLIGWGIKESNLYGIELDPTRARKAQELLPAADLRVGDAVALPWDGETFQLAIASTVFTSVLDQRVRQLIADEIVRVLAPGGALLWYDFAYNNPRNPNVRAINRAEIQALFPALRGHIKQVTLAPPLTRLIAPRWWTLATLLEGIPLLRTHLMAVLVKERS